MRILNKRAKNYYKAYKFTESYYINTNPIIGLCQLIKWVTLKIRKNEFMEFYKKYKAGKFDFKEE